MNALSASSLAVILLTAAARAAEFHVAINGNDQNPGTIKRPFRTIQHAADVAQPGDVITVSAGIYRERINPPRGGESLGARIVYQAAPGNTVVITGSEKATNWTKVQGDVWKAAIPNSFFGGFNPYTNVIQGDWFTAGNRVHHTGAVYLNGDWLAEAASLDDVMKPPRIHACWFGQVDAANTTIWAQFKGVNPNQQDVEMNVRQTVFYPEKTGVNYIAVRGFTLERAATQWASPTTEQLGVIGPHWSKGWLIESNIIRYSICSGISLGKYGDAWNNTASNTADGYVKTIERAETNGWSKENIGGHTVRGNTISHCEQAGIIGSLGAVFSTITGNTITDICTRHWLGGFEQAAIKLHGAIDVTISHNHIYRCNRGLWLDWMAQGTRVSGNLLHDNGLDVFMEANHGPFVLDNNLLLSPASLINRSHGGAYVHNLLTGTFGTHTFETRLMPFFKAHSTVIAGYHANPSGDDCYYNNIFVKHADLGICDHAPLPDHMGGNVFLDGALPSSLERDALVDRAFDPTLRLSQKRPHVYLRMKFDTAWLSERTRPLVTGDLLGKAVVPNLPYEHSDGTPLCIDSDYFGKQRNKSNPTPGPFEVPGDGDLIVNIW